MQHLLASVMCINTRVILKFPPHVKVPTGPDGSDPHMLLLESQGEWAQEGAVTWG